MIAHLVHEELFRVGFTKLAVLSHFPGHTQTKAALVVILVDVVDVLQVVGVISIHVVELVTQLALVLALVDFGVNGLHRAFSITVKRRRFLCIVGHESPIVLVTLHFMLLLYVSSQGECVPDKSFATRLDLTNVDLLVLEDVAMIFPVEILRDSVLGLNVVDKIGTELELLLADLAAKNTPVEPLNFLSFKTTHQLLLVVVQGDLVALGDVLVEGEVVTENAENRK